ncbi:MAG: PPOX class F420-dependent oxidoreductase [Dehalococcoidia bacterium]|jgi:PPOX class probable F420-dependent enzyme
MAVQLPEKAKALLLAPNIANIATIMPNGAPHVVPVWVDYEDGYVLINTAEGRQKLKNIRRDPRVGMDVVDRQDVYAVLALRGHVVEITRDGADAHIDKLAKKYLGQDKYPFRSPGEQRVIIRIEPDRLLGMN